MGLPAYNNKAVAIGPVAGRTLYGYKPVVTCFFIYSHVSSLSVQLRTKNFLPSLTKKEWGGGESILIHAYHDAGILPIELPRLTPGLW